MNDHTHTDKTLQGNNKIESAIAALQQEPSQEMLGESHIDEVAEELGIPVIGKMPIDASLAEAVENENFAEVSNDYLEEAVNKL